MMRLNQVRRLCIPVAGFTLYLFAASMLIPGPAKADRISRLCTDNNLDLINALRACDVLIGRKSTFEGERIRAFQTRAKIHLAAGNVTASLNDLSSAISALPDGTLKGYVLFLRAQTRFDYTKRTASAVDSSLIDLERADTLAPANPRIIETLSRVYWASGQYQNAITRANAVLENDPRALSARMVRAHAYEALGKNRDALDDLNVLLTRQRGNPDLLAWRGRIHEKRRNVVKALADYRNAARIKTTEELLDGITRMKRVLGGS